LQRFIPIEHYNAYNKIKDFVSCPLHANFSNLTDTTTQETQYDLISVINHRGTGGYGEYYAICYDQERKKWYLHDDTKYTEFNDSPINDETCILFYKRIDVDVKVE